MIHRVETFREVRGIVVLQSVKVSHPSNIPNRFYETPKLKIGCVNYACFRKSGHIIMILKLN